MTKAQLAVALGVAAYEFGTEERARVMQQVEMYFECAESVGESMFQHNAWLRDISACIKTTRAVIMP